MKARVTQLYKNGKKIPRDKIVPVVIGDFCMFESHNAVLNRLVMEAMVFEPSESLQRPGKLLFDPIADARVMGVHAHGMLVRGIEYLAGKEVSQE